MNARPLSCINHYNARSRRTRPTESTFYSSLFYREVEPSLRSVWDYGRLNSLPRFRSFRLVLLPSNKLKFSVSLLVCETINTKRGKVYQTSSVVRGGKWRLRLEGKCNLELSIFFWECNEHSVSVMILCDTSVSRQIPTPSRREKLIIRPLRSGPSVRVKWDWCGGLRSTSRVQTRLRRTVSVVVYATRNDFSWIKATERISKSEKKRTPRHRPPYRSNRTEGVTLIRWSWQIFQLKPP